MGVGAVERMFHAFAFEMAGLGVRMGRQRLIAEFVEVRVVRRRREGGEGEVQSAGRERLRQSKITEFFGIGGVGAGEEVTGEQETTDRAPDL